MTRMFKQLVESSRKKLSKARREQAADSADQVHSSGPLAESRKKPDFDVLEGRVLFSGGLTNHGFNRRTVSFTDAWGDSVRVKIVGGPTSARFNITLDGGAPNRADIQNITINGHATDRTVLDIYVTPHWFKLAETYTGGVKIVGDPLKTVYAVGHSTLGFTPGLVQIGSIDATTPLRGITINGGSFQDISDTSTAGIGVGVSAGKHPHPLPGGIAVDMGDAQFRAGMLYDPFKSAGFGNIYVNGPVGALTLRGRTDTPSTNNLNGSIVIHGAVGSIDARYSNVLAPITATSIGSATFDDILANVSTTGAIGSLDASNLVASVTSGGTLGNLNLSGSLLGTVTAPGFTSASVNGNFTGLLQATTAGIGSLNINSGTAFTGTVEALAGNIGSITLSQAATPFSGQIVAAAGNIGSITAGFFSDASVSASGSIGKIVSNSTLASVTSGIVNSAFQAGALGIGNVSSVASITNSQFTAAAGPIGSITVLQGGLSGDVIGGGPSSATTVGAIVTNANIVGTSVFASTSIASVTSTAGFIGGSSNSASFIKAGLLINVNLTGLLNTTGVVTVAGGQPGPKADVFIAGSIGSISALGDIGGNVITATAGSIGNITSHEGRIAFDAVSAATSIGNVYANSQDATFAFDSAGNVLETVASVSGSALTGYTLVPSASAIDHSTFIAGATIGTVTGHASAVGGFFPPSSASAAPVYMANRGIDESTFTAATGIGKVYATAANTTYHASEAYSSSKSKNLPTYANGLDAAIFESNFLVTAATGATGLGNVSAIAIGGPGIYKSTFHAASGNIGAVWGRSVLSNAVYDSSIEADLGNVGIVKGIVTGGNGSIRSDALETVTIGAGAALGGTGSIAGIYGNSAQDNGIDHVYAAAGSGGIGYIKGVSGATIGHATNVKSANGIAASTFTSTGAVGNVTGSTAGSSGIYDSTITGFSIGEITGSTSGYGAGIDKSNFYAAHGITGITASSTNHLGSSGISASNFHANTASDLNGGIGAIIASTAGSTGLDGSKSADAIYDSHFYASSGISSINATVTNVYGGSGIEKSTFNAAASSGAVGAIGIIKATTVGKGGAAITGSNFYAEGIAGVYGAALGAYSSDGIAKSIFNADINHNAGHKNSIGYITGYSDATHGSGSGIADSTFTAASYIGDIHGATTAPATYSYGIGGSTFLASAGDSSVTGGSGTIHSITGTSEAGGAAGFHIGIEASHFIAGSGPESAGYIGPVTGTAIADGGGRLLAYGIESSTFIAGSDHGSIGNISGYGKAEGGLTGSASGAHVYAGGINASNFYTGTGVTSAGSPSAGDGTLGAVTAKAYSESALGAATAHGIINSGFFAGGAGTGHIDGFTVTSTASGHTASTSGGITASIVQAGTLSGGTGYIGPIVATSTAHSQGTAIAYGIKDSGFLSGYINGTIAGVNSIAKAYGEAATKAYGITGYSHATGKAPYGFKTPGGYTFSAGTGAGGVGYIGTVTGIVSATAGAYANYGNATAFGAQSIRINSGAYTGTLDAVTGVAVATADHGAAYAVGINGKITVGIGANGEGHAGAIAGYAYATSTTGSAKAYGINEGRFSSGLNDGVITSVTGNAAATVTYTNTDSTANAVGILKTNIVAGYSGSFGKIGAVTGTATAQLHSSYEDGKYSNSATASGIKGTDIYAQAYYGSATGHGIGIIGPIKGTGHTYAYGYSVTASAYGLRTVLATSSNGPSSTGSIGGIYGYSVVKATSLTDAAKAVGYGIVSSDFHAASGINSVGHITGRIFGSGQATATTDGSLASVAHGYGISATGIYAGTSNSVSKGYITNIEGYGKAVATGGAASSDGDGVNDLTVESGLLHGTIGNVYGLGTATSTSAIGDATAVSFGLSDSTIVAGSGNLVGAYGAIGYVKGIGTAHAYVTAGIGNANTEGVGLFFNTISAASTRGSGEHLGGVGKVAYITGGGYSISKAVGIDTFAKALSYGISNDTVTLGTATSTNGTALGGSGSITGNITGNADSYAKAGNVGSNAYAKSTGIYSFRSYLGNATGATYAKAGHASVGNILTNTSAKAYGAVKTYALDYGTNDLLISAGNSSAGSTPGDISIGGTVAIGALHVSQYAKAVAGAGPGDVFNTGIAKAYAMPSTYVAIKAGYAIGATAYGGNATVSLGVTSTATADAYATGYTATTEAIGFKNISISAGYAIGGYYARGGTGTIGQFEGTAKAYTTLVNPYPGGTSTATAFGIDSISAVAGNAVVSNSLATLSAIGGTGKLGGFLGYGYAKAYAAKTPFTTPTVGTSLAKAYGLFKVYGDAGNATNHGKGPSKTYYGKIGYVGAINGVAVANASTKGGGTASSKAYAYGTKTITLKSANALTFGGGKAIATKAYAYINVIKGSGTANSYAYGLTDPVSKSVGYGIERISLQAGNAYVLNGGTANAYAAGESGAGKAQAIIYGLIGSGSATSFSKGTSTTANPSTAFSRAVGIGYGARNRNGIYTYYGYIVAANAATLGNAYGGSGLVGTGPKGVGLQGTAHALATATATNTILPDPVNSSASSVGIKAITARAGDAISYNKDANAYAGASKIGSATGNAYATANANGDSATTGSSAIGINKSHLYAGYALGSESYAAAASIGAISGIGKAYGTSKYLVNGTNSVSTVHGYGLLNNTLNAGSSIGGLDASGATGTITSITGNGKAVAYGEALGNVYAYSSGDKNTDAYAGDATAPSANAGSNSHIGATIGTGYAKAQGGTTKAISFGVDPIKVFSGVGSGTFYAAGGTTSYVGPITGTATSGSNGQLAVGYAYGINAVDAYSGLAHITSTSSGDRSVAGSGTIGAITGTATNTVDASDSDVKVLGTADGIEKSLFLAGQATGYRALAATGVIGAITGNVTESVTTNGYMPNTGTYASNSYGILLSTASAGRAIGAGTSSRAYGATGTIGYISGSAKVGLYGNVAGSHAVALVENVAGISGLAVYGGTASADSRAVAGNGYIATAGNAPTGAGISGTALVTVNADATTYNSYAAYASFITGVSASNFHAGNALTNSTTVGYALGATGVVGPIYGHGYVNFTSNSRGTRNLYVGNVSGLNEVQALAATASSEVTAYAGTSGALGNITGKAYVTFSGASHGGGSGNIINHLYGIVNGDFVAATGTAAGSGGSVAIGHTGSVGTVYGYAQAKTTSVHATSSGASNTVIKNVSGIAGSEVNAGSANANQTATAGAGTIGDITAKAYVDLAGANVSGSGSSILAYNIYGITHFSAKAGGAYAFTSTSSATAGVGTIGALSVDVYANVTGDTGGSGGAIGARGINAVLDSGLYAGNASAYTATSATSHIAAAGMTLSATSLVTADSNSASTNVYAGTSGGQLITADSFHVFGSVATGSQSSSGEGNASSATATIGFLNSIASATNTNSGALGASSAFVQAADGVAIKAADAYGATADAGAGTIGFIYAKATGTSGGSTAGGAVNVTAVGLQAGTVTAGYAHSTAGTGFANGGASSVGAITGKAYATATGSQSASGITTSAVANGTFDIGVNAGGATGYHAAAGTGGIGGIYGKGYASSTGYIAHASAYGLGIPTGAATIAAGDSTGGTGINADSLAAKGTIGAITGYGKAIASGNTTSGSGAGYSQEATGIEIVTATAGYAKGFDAEGGGASSIAAIAGTAYVRATGTSASNHASVGINTSSFIAGYGRANHGIADGGAGSSVASGASIIGTDTVKLSSPSSTSGTVYGRSATGIGQSTIIVGSAASGASATDKAYAGTGVIGNIKGVANLTATDSSGASATTKLVYGINSLSALAGNAKATGYAKAAKGNIGYVYGKADAHLSTGFLSGTTSATGSDAVQGINVTNITAGYASAGTALVTQIARGGAGSSIGAITGKAYAYADGNTTDVSGPPPVVTSSTSTAHAYAATSVTATAGVAHGYKAYAGSGNIGAVYGKSVADAVGNTTTTVSAGIQTSLFSAGSAYAGGSKGSLATAASGTVASIIGYAYAYSDSVTGNAHAHATGLANVNSNLGYATSTGGTAGVGTVTGAIKGTGKAYGVSGTVGDGFGYGYGIRGGKVVAGFLPGGNATGSAIGSVGGYGTGSDAAVHATVAGTHTYGFGINTKVYSGGSIGGITGNASLAASTSISYGIGSSTFKAGGAITGAISAKNTATGAASQTAITSSNFVAATSLFNIYASDASTSADSVSGSNFRAGSGGVGTVKAYSGNTTSATLGFQNSIVTTSGSIGAITIKGSVFGTSGGITGGFFAGDDLGVGYAIGGAGASADNLQGNQSIGTVNITGFFENADMIASVTNGAGFFGGNGDSNTGGSTVGGIGNITIGNPNATTVTNVAETFAIEGLNLGFVHWGTTTVTNNQSVTNAGGGSTIRVRTI